MHVLTFEDARQEIQTLAIDYNRGAISLDVYTDRVGDVLAAFKGRVAPVTVTASAPATTATGAPAYTTDQFAAERRTWFPDGDPSDRHDVQGHAA